MERYIASSGSGLFDALLSDLLHKIANLPYEIRALTPTTHHPTAAGDRARESRHG